MCEAGSYQAGRRQLSLSEAGCQMWAQPDVNGMLSWPTPLGLHLLLWTLVPDRLTAPCVQGTSWTVWFFLR